MDELNRAVVGVSYSTLDLRGFSLWRHIFHGLVAAGATPVSIDCTVEQPHVDTIVDRLDGLVISGGGDVDPILYGGDPTDQLLRGVNHARDTSERAALLTALNVGMPILAICRGFQLVNATLGGTLHADLARDRPGPLQHRKSDEALAAPAHDVEVCDGSLLATWIGEHGVIPVNSQHHQGIDQLAPSLTAVARASDGLVEAAEDRTRRLVGVQWHPEILWPYERSSASLLDGFVRECKPARGNASHAGSVDCELTR